MANRRLGVEQEFHVVEGTLSKSGDFEGSGTLTNRNDLVSNLVGSSSSNPIIRRLNEARLFSGITSGALTKDFDLVEARTMPESNLNNIYLDLHRLRAGTSALLRPHGLALVALGMFATNPPEHTVLDPRGTYPIGARASLQVNVELRYDEHDVLERIRTEIDKNLGVFVLVGQSLPASVEQRHEDFTSGSWRVRYEGLMRADKAHLSRIKDRIGAKRLELRVADSLASVADVMLLAAMGRAAVDRAALVARGQLPQAQTSVSLGNAALGLTTRVERTRAFKDFIDDHRAHLTAAGDFNFVTKRLSWLAQFGSEADLNKRIYRRNMEQTYSGKEAAASMLSFAATSTASGTRPLETARAATSKSLAD